MSGPPPGGEDLDDLIRRVDPDRWLSSRFIADPRARADAVAIYAYDHELRRAPQLASKALMAEIRLTWWGEVLDQIYAGGPVRRHPTAQALAEAVERGALPREPLEGALDARLYALGVTAGSGEAEAAGHIAAAAALRLDPNVDLEAVRALGRAWAERRLDSPCRAMARRVSAAAFPAVAHAALVRAPAGAVRRRLRLTWAVAAGRV